MRRLASRLFAVGAVAVLVAAVSACGSPAADRVLGHGAAGKAHAGGTPSGPLLRPQPGHVIRNPSPAASYIYLPMTVQRESNGDILIADGGNWNRVGSKVVELSPQGKPVWEYTGGLDFTHSAYPIGHGQILLSDTNNDRVLIINHQGKVLWNTDNLGGGRGYLGRGRFSNGGRLLYPNDAVLLRNGHMLISSRMNSTVYEVDRSGHVFWQCNRFMLRQHRPRLLPNGNLMVADSDNARAIIINHGCNTIVWQYNATMSNGLPQVIWPRTFNPLPNGNYLIGDSVRGRILEVNRNKQIVHVWGGFPGNSIYYVDVEGNGNLLFGNTSVHGGVEMAPSGKLVHVYATHMPHALPAQLVNGGFETHQPHAWIQGDLLTESLPSGVRANMGYDTHIKHSGTSSGRISWTSNLPHTFLFWTQTVAVHPGRTYTFTGWAKSQNLTGCAGCDFGKGTQVPPATYSLSFVAPGPYAAPPAPALPLIAGTTDWTPYTTTFTVPQGVTGVAVDAVLWGKGTVWFDDVSLK